MRHRALACASVAAAERLPLASIRYFACPAAQKDSTFSGEHSRFVRAHRRAQRQEAYRAAQCQLATTSGRRQTKKRHCCSRWSSHSRSTTYEIAPKAPDAMRVQVERRRRGHARVRASRAASEASPPSDGHRVSHRERRSFEGEEHRQGVAEAAGEQEALKWLAVRWTRLCWYWWMCHFL